MSESTVFEFVLQKKKPQIQELLIAKSGLIIVQIHWNNHGVSVVPELSVRFLTRMCDFIPWLSFPNPEPSAQPCNNSEEKLQMIHITRIFSIAKNTHSQVFDAFLANNRGKKKKKQNCSQILNQACFLITGSSLGSLQEPPNEFCTCNKEKKPKQQLHDA